jgi:uncharacterized protein DUF6541
VTSAVRAALAAAMVLLAPGLCVAVFAGRPVRSLTTWAAVPALSLGAVFVLAEVTTAAGSNFGTRSFLMFLAVLAAAAVVTARRPGRDGARAKSATRLPLARASYVLLLLGIVAGVSIWAVGTRGVAVVPPRQDSANHGFFVARIVHTRSIAPDDVVVTDAQAKSKVADYYPLGMHASAALVHELGDVQIGRVLDAFVVFFGAVVFPVGIFLLARRLTPTRPLVAGLTALTSPFFCLYAYNAAQNGLLPLLVAMAIIPITVLLVATVAVGDAARGHVAGRWPDLVLAGLALVAVTSVHTTEVVTVGLLGGVLVIAEVRRSRTALFHALRNLAVVGGVAALLLAPIAVQVGGGVSERGRFDVFSFGGPTSLGRALAGTVKLENRMYLSGDERHVFAGRGPHHDQALYAVLSVMGAAVMVVRRQPAWVVAWLVFIGLTVLAYTSNGAVARTLAYPWYRQGDRLAMNQAFFAPFFAAVAIEAVCATLLEVSRHRRMVVFAALPVAVLAVVVAVDGYDQAHGALQYSYNGLDAPVTAASQRGFRYLHQHSARGDVVVNDMVDGSTWMYAEAGVAPLFGVRAGDGNIIDVLRHETRDLLQRNYLARHVDEVGRNPTVDDSVRRFRARWVYFGESTFRPHFTRWLRLPELRRNPRLREVYDRGGIHVFRVDVPPAT